MLPAESYCIACVCTTIRVFRAVTARLRAFLIPSTVTLLIRALHDLISANVTNWCYWREIQISELLGMFFLSMKSYGNSL